MENKKYKVGYTQGTYDLFHIGHLNLLENAKKNCEYLIVGINSDDLVKQYKSKKVNVPEQDRARIVQALKVVDRVIIVPTLNKEDILSQVPFDVIFIGDDWKGNQRWIETEQKLAKYNVQVEYLPHTDGISTTELTERIKKGNKIESEVDNER